MGFMNLFRKKKMVVCPRCLTAIPVTIDTKVCSECKFEIPPAYIRDYETTLPIFIQVFGWSSVGKTMWLDVMRLNLFEMSNIWPKCIYESVTQIDLDHERILRKQRKNGEMPDSTQAKERDQNQVYMMKLKDMERWGSRTLVIMDHAGERFEKFDIPMQEIPYLLKVPTTFMLISLRDMLDNNSGETMNQLLNIYITAMQDKGVRFDKERRKLIFVFTKADLIDLPSNLRNYLISDDIWARINADVSSPFDSQELAVYVERMGRVSDEIKHWIETDKSLRAQGRVMNNLLKDNNIEARYTLISATGQDVSDTNGAFQLIPRRVLDPFFWALELQSR